MVYRQARRTISTWSFRGTASHDDVLRDVMAVPEEFGGLRFHKGFLGGVLHNEELKAHLRSCPTA